MPTNQLFLTPDRAIFVGPVQDNELHRHHALQMVVSPAIFRLAVGPGDSRAENSHFQIASFFKSYGLAQCMVIQ
jgi:hypothetical protein